MRLRRRFADGQSMLEAVIATGIIVTAVSSALTLVSSSINAEKESEYLLAAGNLAREGVEVARMMRDSNWLAGASWDAGMTGASNDYSGIPVFDAAANGWSVNFTPNTVADATAKVYRYSTGSGHAVVGLMVQGVTQPANTVGTPDSRLLIMDPLCDDGAGGYTIVTSGTPCSTTKIGVRVTSKVRWMVKNQAKTLDMEER